MSAVTQFDDPTYLEDVYAALQALLQQAIFAGGITLNSVQRAFEPPDNVAVADQPALILIEGPLDVEQKTAFALAKWTMSAIASIYLRANPAATDAAPPLPITQANYLVWGIKNCFNTTPPYQKQTLGGLVVHAWIEGLVVPQVLNEQVLITIPILMLAGPSGAM